MTQNEFYRQIAEQTGEDMQTIERLGFSPVVPRHRYYAKRRFHKRRKKQAATPATANPASTPYRQEA